MYKDITIEEMLGVNSLNWSLLHTFARKPNLAAAVRSLNLAIMLPKLKFGPEYSPGGYSYDFDLFDRLSRDLPCDLRRTWRHETGRDPSLESDSYGIATYAAVVLHRSTNVRRLEIECRSCTDVAPFFRLPNLTKLRASDVTLGDMDLSTLGRTPDINVPPESGLFDHLAQLHKTSLERLWLGLRYSDIVSAYDEGFIRSFLPEFTRLKVLRIHVRSLMEFNHRNPTGYEEPPLNKLGDVLPASLEVLCITTWGMSLSQWLPDHVERMMSKGQTPALRTLVVDAEIPPSTGYKQSRMKEYPRLAAVCEKGAIQLIFLDSSYMNSVWSQPDSTGA
ncbi:hypothetical protein BDW69DRAFT_188471 [Aspergillus filifer]